MEKRAPADLDAAGRHLQLRVQSIAAGVCMTLLVCAALAVWVALTWSQPNRGAIAALVVLAAAAAVAVALLPARKLVASRLREPFFMAWSFFDVTLVLVLADLDGGVGSPTILLLFLTLVFAALSYPLLPMVFVAVHSVLGVLVLGLTSPGGTVDAAQPSYLFMLTITLALTGGMCVWQSRLHDARNRDLDLLSRCDPLTGAMNRRGFESAFRRALEAGDPLSLILLDLNDFKSVNDASGHAAGDELLRWCVEVMRGVVRPSDVVGRLGGDEFAVLLPGVGDGSDVAARIVSALAERIGCAVGVAAAPLDGSDPDELHRCADRRMYRAKPVRA